MKRGISTVAAVILTLIIMGAGIFAGYNYLSQQKEKQINDKQNEIGELTKQVKELKDQVALDVSGSNSTTTSTTSNNKAGDVLKTYTYTSTKYGYSFKYPSTYSLVDWLWDGQNKKKVPQEGKIVWVDKEKLGDNAILMDADPIFGYIDITVSDDQCGLSQLKGEGIKIEDTTFLGIKGWKTTVTDATNVMGGNYTSGIHINKGNYCYNIYWVNTDASGTHDTEIDTIVESFKFL